MKKSILISISITLPIFIQTMHQDETQSTSPTKSPTSHLSLMLPESDGDYVYPNSPDTISSKQKYQNSILAMMCSHIQNSPEKLQEAKNHGLYSGQIKKSQENIA